MCRASTFNCFRDVYYEVSGTQPRERTTEHSLGAEESLLGDLLYSSSFTTLLSVVLVGKHS